MFRKIISLLLIGALLISAAIPALAETLYATVKTPTTDGAVYIRRVAGVGQPIVGSAKHGDQLIVLQKGNTWHKVKVVRTGVSGWAYGQYITFSQSTSDVNQPGVVASSDGYANFRTGPGTKHSIIAPLNNGTKLEVISKTGSWYYVHCPAKKAYGYVSANLVKLTAASAESTTPAQNAASVKSSDGFANLRKGPGTNYGVVTKLYNGTEVEIVSSSGNWSRVNVPSTNQYGYVYTKLLKTAAASATAKPSQTVKPAETAKPAAGAYVTGKINSSDGYANLRTGPGTKNSVMAKLYNNVLVSILSTEGSWCKVQLSDAGRIGYVSKDLVETVKTEGTMVTTSSVNLRSGPSTDYAKRTKLDKGVTVSVLSIHGNFARVNAQGWIGYVSLSYLK